MIFQVEVANRVLGRCVENDPPPNLEPLEGKKVMLMLMLMIVPMLCPCAAAGQVADMY